VRAQRRALAMQWLLRERLKMPEGVIEYAAPWISDSATRSDRGTGGRWRSRCRRTDFRLAISQRCLPTRAANRGWAARGERDRGAAVGGIWEVC